MPHATSNILSVEAALSRDIYELILFYLDNNGLKQCSLINSDFLPAAQRLLFGTISIRTQKELNNILSILEFSPHIAAYITALSIEGCDLFHLGARMDTIVAFLWLLPSLDDLHLNRTTEGWSHFSPFRTVMEKHTLPNLRKLRIEGIAQFPVEILLHCRHLRSLELSDLELVDFSSRPAFAIQRIPLQSLKLNKLRVQPSRLSSLVPMFNLLFDTNSLLKLKLDSLRTDFAGPLLRHYRSYLVELNLGLELLCSWYETNCDAIIHLDQFPCLETLQVHWSGVEFLGYVPEPALRWTISHLAIRGPHPLQKFILEGAAESAWFQIDASVWKMLDDLLMQDYFTALSTVELRAEYYIVVDDSGLEDSISCFRHWKDTTPLPRFQARSNATLALMVRERRRRKRISLSPLFVV